MADTALGDIGPDLYLPPFSENDLPPIPFPTDGQALAPMPEYDAAEEAYDVGVEERFSDKEAEYEGGGIFGDVVGPVDKAAPSPPAPRAVGGRDFAPQISMRQVTAGPNIGPLPPVVPGPMGPMGHIPPQHAHNLGLTAVSVVVGSALGVKYGGMYGGLAGGLFAGAAVNAYRALSFLKGGTEETDREARVSGTYAVGAAAIGAVVWAKLVDKGFAENPSSGPQGKITENASACGIRPVGP